MQQWEYFYFVTQRFGHEAWIINEDFIISDAFDIDRSYPSNKFKRKKIDMTGEGVWYCYPSELKTKILGTSVIEALNVVGSLGWELLSVNRSNYEHYYYFKRPKE